MQAFARLLIFWLKLLILDSNYGPTWLIPSISYLQIFTCFTDIEKHVGVIYSFLAQSLLLFITTTIHDHHVRHYWIDQDACDIHIGHCSRLTY